MHEFFCCEAMVSSQAMSAADAVSATAPSTILFGDVYLSVHQSDLDKAALLFGCKSRGTLLDVLTPCGGTLATAPMKETALAIDALNNVVNMDTCLVR